MVEGLERSAGGFSVIIATFDAARLPLLRRCVEALAVGTLRPHEVLVCVDSNPELSERLRSELSGVARVIDGEGNGASAMRNTGLRVATGEFVACLDDDTVPAPDWIEALGRAFDAHPNGVALGGRIVPDYEPGGRPVPDELLWVVGSTYRGHRVDAGPITRPIGANMAFRREAIVAVGGFDPAFGPIGATRLNSNEEIELSESLRQQFGRDTIWYIPEACVGHYVPARRTTLRYLVERCRAEGKSKARVRRRYGSGVMQDDSSYVRTVLVPAIIGRFARGVVTFDATGLGDGLRLALAAMVTATSYGLTMLKTSSLPRSVRKTSVD